LALRHQSLIPTLGMELNIQSALTTAKGSSTASRGRDLAGQPPTLLTRESPSTAVIPVSQFSLWAINQPGGLAPAGAARWSVMVLFLQTVEGHPYCATQAIILNTAPSPLLLPTASGSVTSSYPPLTSPDSSLAAPCSSQSFIPLLLLSSSFISPVMLSHVHRCN